MISLCKTSPNALPTPRNASNLSWSVFDLPKQEAELASLEQQAAAPDLWDNPTQAQQLMKRVAALREEVESWRKLEQRISDNRELAELGDESLRAELETEAEAVEREVDQRELRTLLSGEYDNGNALLSINAGAGGTDSQDWAAMLQRMYLRWAEEEGYKTEIIDSTAGEEAGIKSVTIAVSGPYAYGYLRPEKGVHRLVRLSPFDSARRRHTSFAQVEVLPQVDDVELEINPNDLRIDTFRSGGAGGQNVQKNDTAVRITHIPTGIVASCQNERSQAQNRDNAMRVLKARLLEVLEAEQAQELAQLRGEYQKAEWGSQIRSYVLHPYQLVKDHRTEYEEGNSQAVLDGRLNGFIEAYLRSQVGNS
ncbi:MAG: peptide chain release factor 2 [Anaerolineales bacterium]|nr:MAG: peptide chain release factor 2 [Anaerolineales bacterium]